VTTAKDAVRCDFDVAVLPMTVSIEPAADFESWLMNRLRADPPACLADAPEARRPRPRSGEGG